MRNKTVLNVIIGLIGLVAALPGVAHAWVKACNNSNITLYVSTAFFEGNDQWKVNGWTRVESGECANVTDRDIRRYDNATFYLHAEDGRGDENWGDGPTFCTRVSGDFTHFEHSQDNGPCPDDLSRKEYEPVVIHDRAVSNFTWNLDD